MGKSETVVCGACKGKKKVKQLDTGKLETCWPCNGTGKTKNWLGE